MELHPAFRLTRLSSLLAVCRHYVSRLRLPRSDRRALLADACRPGEPAATAMMRLHRRIAGDSTDSEAPALASIRGRLALVYGSPTTAAGPVIANDSARGTTIATTPPVNRSSMAPRHWRARRLFGLLRLVEALLPRKRATAWQTGRASQVPHRDSPDPRGHWHGPARLRRATLAILVGAQTYLATYFMISVLPYHGDRPLELIILLLFVVLCFWVSMGFWMAIAGFLVLLLKRDRYAISATDDGRLGIDPSVRTAVVMPIYNENVRRVFAGLRATYESLSRTDEADRFDLFVLSDSSDPDARVAEADAWIEMCRELNAFGRVFYRWRQHHIKRKSGNIADFCRRWGRNYKYIVVLDADSVMSGACLAKLVRLMEANPGAGIIQTAPYAAGLQTLHARIQQFANRVYGPVFVAGLHFFELGETRYWGHNAIIRIAPFMQHCALARFPRLGNRSREILSHDFVEAALMRRAGWAVWVAYDVPGSYEEMPPSLIDELKRDRRWCQGNLINFRLAWARGLHPAHRAVFITGVMAYVSAPLWFLFLLSSTLLLGIHTLVEPEYFVQPQQLFPLWPEWHPARGIGLYVATTMLLFLPKILGVVLVWAQGARGFGGRLRLVTGLAAEMLYSALLAPIRMLFHTQFVVSALFGWALQWKSPPREDNETAWGDALRHHGLHTLLGVAWAGVVYWLNPAFLWWLLPVVGALVVSMPLSVYSSRVSLGRALRRMRLFLIPEESDPPQELLATKQGAEQAAAAPGFLDAVVDPIVNALACASRAARLRPARQRAEVRQRQNLVDRALTQGPNALDAKHRCLLLRDRLALSELHLKVWSAPEAHPDWIDARMHPTRRVEVVPARFQELGPATKDDAPVMQPLMPPGVPLQASRLLG